MSRNGSRPLATADLLLAGGTAGMTSWLFLYPIDVIKSRLQADTEGRYRNAWHCFQDSLQRNGWRVFGRGLAPTLLRAFPVNAITFLVVEWVFRLANGFGRIQIPAIVAPEKNIIVVQRQNASEPQENALKPSVVEQSAIAESPGTVTLSVEQKQQQERQAAAAKWWFLADSKAAMLESMMN